MSAGEVIAAMAAAQGENNRRRVFGALQRAGSRGMSTKELRDALKLGESSVGVHLRSLRFDGLATKHPFTGCSSRWYVAGTQPDAPKPKEKRPRKRVKLADWADVWIDRPIVRRVIPASEAPRLVTKARGLWDV